MSKFPVEISDQEGIVDAVNYLLSGPSGLGQNFEGFSEYEPVYVRPTVQGPFTLPITTTLDTSLTLDIPINNITVVGGNPSNQLQLTFTTPFADPPFQFGDLLDISNVVDSGAPDEVYDGTNYRVLSCTTTDVILFTRGTYTWATYISGGNLIRNFNNQPLSTDCNAFITVTGPTDRVFVTAQIELSMPDLSTVNPGGPFEILVQVNRYVGTPNSLTQNNPNDFSFDFDKTVTQQMFNYNNTYNDGDPIRSYFTTIIDGPNIAPGYYWYILDVSFVTRPNNFNAAGIVGYSTAGYATPALGQITSPGDELLGFIATPGAANLQFQGNAPGTTFTTISPTTITGSGVGAVVDVTVYPDVLFPQYDIGYDNGTVYGTVVIVATTPGFGYKPGDILLIDGAALGGTSGINDLTMTVTATRLIDPGPPIKEAQCGKMVAGLRSLTAQVIKQ